MRTAALILIALFVSLVMGCSRHPSAPAAPRSGMRFPLDTNVSTELGAVIMAAVERHDIPGAVLVTPRERAAVGCRELVPRRLPMRQDTLFDLASLTKPIATATSIMILAERGEIHLTDPVARYIPAFAANGKGSITIEELLLHRGGLPPDDPLSDYVGGDRDAKLARVFAVKPIAPPGARFIYSDVGYIVLGELVRIVDGRPLDRFAAEEIFKPLGMTHTAFNPPAAWRQNVAATQWRDGVMLTGVVHDPRSAALGGVAGHAGLFSTAHDVARFCRMILHGGELDGHRILRPETVATMTTPRGPLLQERAYGFDVDTLYSAAPRGERFAIGSTFGHTGFTGTMFWIDPRNQTYVVLLTNRVHPDGGGRVSDLRYAVSTLAAPKPSTPVLTGIDVLERKGFKPLTGRRIGLITNQTGVDALGRRDIDLLAAAHNVKLVAIFSPEHGIAGTLDQQNIGSTRDPATGLPIYSLYGETRRPTGEMLRGIDTLVFDIQDVGVRFYTYIATMREAMRAAAEHGARFVVLDRPNPLGGEVTDGPLADSRYLGFVACAPIPVVHGLTVGELATLFNASLHPAADLQVVTMHGWRRSMRWSDTGLTWVNPSPNIRSPREAELYPMLGLLEMTDVSVGRGTATPFELLGAPWIDPRKLDAALTALQLPGVSFQPAEFTPSASKFTGRRCGGVRITRVGSAVPRPVEAGLAIAWTLQKLYGPKFDGDKVLKLLANDAAQSAWQHAADPGTIGRAWAEALRGFGVRRRAVMLYR